MTPSGIEPATFGFAAQRLNHCATAVAAVEYKSFCYLVSESSDCLWDVHDDFAILRDVTPCSLVEIWRRSGKTCLRRGRRVGGGGG